MEPEFYMAITGTTILFISGIVMMRDVTRQSLSYKQKLFWFIVGCSGLVLGFFSFSL